MTDTRPEGAGVDPEGATPPSGTGDNSVARNSAIMAMGTFGSRILGFVRMALLTGVVGAALASDSYTVANSLPTQIYVLINGGLLSALLIPQITKAMLRKDGGQDFSDRLITACFLVLGVSTIACLAAAPWIVRLLSDNDRPNYLSLTTTMAYICLPQLFFYGLYSVLGQVLNARGHFVAYAWAPAWANVVQIIGLTWFIIQWGKQPTVDTWTPAMIWLLGGTTTLGIVVQGVCLVAPLLRSGFAYRPRFGWRGYGFGEMSRMGMWTIAALLVSQAYGFLSTYTYSTGSSRADNVAGNGAQGYAYTFYMLPHSIITISIITAMFPAMSRAHEQGDLAAMRRWLVHGLTAPAVLVLPASAALIALGRPLVSTLLPGTDYIPSKGIDQARDIALILAVSAVGSVPFGITALKQRYCFARGDGKMNFWTVVLLMAGNALGCVVALLWTAPQYVVAVVAGGASISNFIAAGAFLLIARSQLGGLNLATVARMWTRLTVAATISGVAGWGVAALIADPGSPWLSQFLALACGGIALAVVFYGFARLMKIREVDEMLAPILRRLPGRA
ncbi:murein biosynthesis integral membrane protein MurJ [Knoellia sp. CPCC 206453]|uniref:murein biosynthesis integral membrane protein MurJ n=1 Tax=Knoellia pratensis TaxID=3404796 RepID=UPI00360618DF